MEAGRSGVATKLLTIAEFDKLDLPAGPEMGTA